jgi:hypothetical protein
MRRKRVESTTMRSMGYAAKDRILEIEFQTGTIYQYLEVPKTVYQEFQNAESKGQYFNRAIRDQYEFVRLGVVRRAARG